MQYLLSEDEYHSLIEKADDGEGSEALREACTTFRVNLLKMNNVMCVHSTAKLDKNTRRLYYCSECPVMQLSPDRDIRKAMCPHDWEFSK